MFLTIEENPNCEAVEGRVWQERSTPQPVAQILRRRSGAEVWCEITGLDNEMKLCPVIARKVEDSGDGICWLVTGGQWGLRLKDPVCHDSWSLQDTHQWAEPFLLLPSDGADIRFLPTRT